MKVLISAPRAGSSYVYEHIEKYNLTLPNVKKIGPEEYLDPNQMPFLTLNEKIEMLEEGRLLNIEYTFKHHINYLKKDVDYYNTWFKDFYKGHEILVLKRRDTWRWFLSFLFQDCVGWDYAAVMKDSVLAEQEIKNKFNNYDYKKTLTQFFEIKQQIDTVEGNIIFYEDLKYSTSKYCILSSLINYEEHFNNIDDIKNEFNTYSRYMETHR